MTWVYLKSTGEKEFSEKASLHFKVRENRSLKERGEKNPCKYDNF